MVNFVSCSPEEKQSALQRALESRTLARSEQLRSFLRFICEAEFRGSSATLTEYVIGVEVLHRPPNYSPGEDSSVRTRAYELRQKLDKLYAEELKGEAVHIFIPKGAYTPQFLHVPAASAETGTTAPEAAPLVAVTRRSGRPGTRVGSAVVVAVAVISALCGASIAFFVKTGMPRRSGLDRIVAEVWGSVAKVNGSTLLVSATPLYLVLGPASHGAFGTPTYPAPPEAYSLFRLHRPLQANAGLGMVLTDDAVGVGNLNAVVLASSVVRDLGGQPQILPERPAMMSEFHGRDVVLFGAPVDSQVISEVLDKTPLTVDYEEKVREFVIRDRVAGTYLVPEKTPADDFRTVYGLVTVLNTREWNNGRLGMIVFSGITSVGTHGAAEYFCSPQSLTALREIFAREGVHGFPPAYQVVVKCTFDHMLLVAREYQSHRILKRE